jgi:hypothetical protein
LLNFIAGKLIAQSQRTTIQLIQIMKAWWLVGYLNQLCRALRWTDCGKLCFCLSHLALQHCLAGGCVHFKSWVKDSFLEALRTGIKMCLIYLERTSTEIILCSCVSWLFTLFCSQATLFLNVCVSIAKEKTTQLLVRFSISQVHESLATLPR